MKKIILFITLSSLIFINTLIVNAHPGNTDSDGGHYCWTNCAEWGELYGEYHYHNDTITDIGYYCPKDFNENDYFSKKQEIENLEISKRKVMDGIRARYPTLPLSQQLTIADKEIEAIDDDLNKFYSEITSLTKKYYACESLKTDKEREQLLILNNHLDKGDNYIVNKDYFSAINEYKEALKIKDDVNVKDKIASIYFDLGINNININKEYDLAINNFNEVLIYTSNIELIYNSYINIGVGYFKKGNYDEALNFNNTAKKYALNSGNEKIANANEIKSLNERIKTITDLNEEISKKQIENINQNKIEESKLSKNNLLKSKYKDIFNKKIGDKINKIEVSTLNKLLDKINKILQKTNKEEVLAKIEALKEIIEEAIKLK